MGTLVVPRAFCSQMRRTLLKLERADTSWRRRRIHCSSTQKMPQFFEMDRRSGYGKKPEELDIEDMATKGVKMIIPEMKKYIQEWKLAFDIDPPVVYPGVVDIAWDFDPDNGGFTGWVTGCDSDHEEGFSRCELVHSPAGYALFHGTLCQTPPKDGRVRFAGYCNMTATRPLISFARESYYDWGQYTHIVLRVRGDGRTYMVTLGAEGHFDVNWNDRYSFALHTRGGPYWQYTRLPFSRFYLSAKGRIQDRQCALNKTKITTFGISAGDYDGPFSLEIDYVGLEDDPSHKEEFAYELYTPSVKYIGAL